MNTSVEKVQPQKVGDQKDERVVAIECASNILSNWATKNTCDMPSVMAYIDELYSLILKKISTSRSDGAYGFSKEDAESAIQNTVYPDYIICLEDGKKLKMLKRHLWSRYKMTLLDYKLKWGLPADYPSVAPNYAQKRSSIAKLSRGKGLNRGNKNVE